MAAKTLTQTLAELHSFGDQRARRSARIPDAAPLIVRLLSPCKTLAIEQRVSGLAFRMQGQTDSATTFTLTCVLHSPATDGVLTVAEKSKKITPKHLLLALLERPQPDPAAALLAELGVDRAEVARRLA